MPHIKAMLQKFDKDKGWYFIPVPISISAKHAHLADRGLIAITATVGEISWKTSMLPVGDGTHFIAIPQKIRGKYDLHIRDIVEVYFELR